MIQSYKNKIKWVVYGLLLLVFYVLQTTPMLFQILGIKPVLITPLVVCIALFESEAASAAFGVVAGLFWDISSGKVFGFHAVILMCCCIAISLLIMYLMRNNLLNALFFVAMVMLLEGLLDYLFYYLIWSYDSSYIILLNYTLPTLIYTTIITIPVYFLVKAIAFRFNENPRV